MILINPGVDRRLNCSASGIGKASGHVPRDGPPWKGCETYFTQDSEARVAYA